MKGTYVVLFLLAINVDKLAGPRAAVAARDQRHRTESAAWTYGGLSCPSVPCPVDLHMLHSAFVHMVVGTEHASALPLLMHRVCDFSKQCVGRSNMRIVLHNKKTSISMRHREAVSFLQHLNIQPADEWNGTFTADAKMAASYSALRGLHSHDTMILQMDVDEEPDPVLFNQALREIEAQKCDAVFAFWQDRLALGGNLSRVQISSGAPLVEQFPLQCELSAKVVRGGKTAKTIAYRADARLDGGQHDVWCDRSGNSGVGGSERWNKTRACAQHAHDRAKSKLLPLILAHTSNLQARPRFCRTKVPLRHYKFLHGVEEHLARRMESYRRLGLHWWRDSRLFLEHLRRHGGRVCVECAGMGCVDTRTGQPVRESLEESSFS